MIVNNDMVLACFGQLNRDNKFKILTKIIDGRSHIFVRKEAYCKNSISHINNLISSHEKLRKTLASLKNVRIVEILESGAEYVDFEYIKGLSLEYVVYKEVLTGNFGEAARNIDKIFSLLDNLSSPRHPAERGLVKKINHIYEQTVSIGSGQYTSPGLIDANLDNFIVDSTDKLVVFDYEWVFDMPIATEFIKTRILYTFLTRRTDAFSYLSNENNPYKSLIVGDLRTLIPLPLYEKYMHFFTKDSMERYLLAEDLFQKFVNERHVSIATKSIANYSLSDCVTPKLTFPEEYTTSIDKYERRHRELVERNKSLELELQSFKSFLPIRVLRKIKRTKKRLIG